jgi:hypothetical protein
MPPNQAGFQASVAKELAAEVNAEHCAQTHPDGPEFDGPKRKGVVSRLLHALRRRSDPPKST